MVDAVLLPPVPQGVWGDPAEGFAKVRHAVPMLSLGLPASMLVALAFHRLVEQPCQDWSRRIGRRAA